MSIEEIIYDTYGNISDKDYDKIYKIFKEAEDNTELYDKLRMYTKCYCFLRDCSASIYLACSNILINCDCQHSCKYSF